MDEFQYDQACLPQKVAGFICGEGIDKKNVMDARKVVYSSLLPFELSDMNVGFEPKTDILERG